MFVDAQFLVVYFLYSFYFCSPFFTGKGKCGLLTKQEGVCVDIRHPDFSSSLDCPINCAKVNGAVLVQPASKQHSCLRTCESKSSNTCPEWIARVFTVGGCGLSCPLDVKLKERPSLSCTFNVDVGARVQINSLKKCVVAVDKKRNKVVAGDVDSKKFKKYSIDKLVLIKAADAACAVQQERTLEIKSTNVLTAVIDGPRQVSICDTKVRINSFNSENSGPLSQLKYKWNVSKTDLKALSKKQQNLDLPALTFKSLSVGDHHFGLQLVNKAGATAHAPPFKLSVAGGPSPKVDLSCPPSTCNRTVDGVYEFDVDLREKTRLQLDVHPAENCGAKNSNKKSALSIEWEQHVAATTEMQRKKTTPPQINWQSLRLGKLRNKKRSLFIEPWALSPCTPTELRVSVKQKLLKSQTVLRIKLKPRPTSLVAKLKTTASRVGYHNQVVLRADKSYDPLTKFYDLSSKQVNLRLWFIGSRVTRSVACTVHSW